ncbi:MAG: hypothetical protein IPN26_17815 [Bacteroidetes bacterium]|nr:hypothetical protein [Bacteroidota bacterium]
MAQINPYIHFNGNAEEAFTFYKSTLNGDFETSSASGCANLDYPIPENEANKIVHCFTNRKTHSTLMGSDTLQAWENTIENENKQKFQLAQKARRSR